MSNSLGVSPNRLAWYHTTYRWGQTNITELDPARYDIDWWRAYWQRTHLQGVIINAAGIVAYYPSRYRLQYRAHYLEDRDLFGELARAAHEDGLAVLARMDSNRASVELLREQSDWFARDINGDPYPVGDRYVTCVNSRYYSEFLPDILREIIANYHPEGFTDNSWSGLGRDQICYCTACDLKFHSATGHDLPRQVDWEDPIYRAWVRWSYDCRLELWERNNGVTQAVGGPECLWLGMNSGNLLHQSQRLRDVKAICERSEILMLDHQTRGADVGFSQNGDAGKMMHGLLGWETVIPESMAQYQGRNPTFRLASKPAPEVHLWMLEAFAGGIQPWWHFISAYHEDRRQYRTPEPHFRWHAAHEQYLLHRQPVAKVGVLWSQENLDFYGRELAYERVMLPYHGITRALIRARIPYLPLHADYVARDGAAFTTLILPNLAAVSDAQIESLRAFVEQGGNLVVTGESTRYNEWGERRPDFALGDLLGIMVTDESQGTLHQEASNWESYTAHSYLRLDPEQRAMVDGPHSEDEPMISGERHAVLNGFGETDILPFGGLLTVVEPNYDVDVPLTWIPPFPIYPPEFAWMRQQTTEHPGLTCRHTSSGGRIAYLAADLDRLYARHHLPDHGELLANIVRWASQESSPLQVEGPGLIDCHLYRQPGRMILHLVNLTAAGQDPVEEHVPVGPLQIAIQLPADVTGRQAQQLVAEQPTATEIADGWVVCTVPTVHDHEVLVIT